MAVVIPAGCVHDDDSDESQQHENNPTYSSAPTITVLMSESCVF